MEFRSRGCVCILGVSAPRINDKAQKMTRSFRFLLPIALCVFTATASAQLSVHVDSVDVSAYPTVRVFVTTKVGLLLRKDLSAANFTIKEDGFRQSPLVYKGTRGTEPYALAMCIAAGSSMSAGDMVFAGGIGNKLLDSLDCPLDEMGIFVYDNALIALSSPDLNCNYSTLRNTLSTLSTTPNGNKFWDGVFAGVDKLAFNSVNPSRALFVLSNGFDDGSGKNLGDILTRAAQTSIKIHTFNIGSTGGISNLQALSNGTGGTYFSNADEAVQNIVNSLRGTPTYCILEYTSNFQCKDGLPRNLAVGVRVDNDSVETTSSYTILADPSSKVEATFAVDTGSVTAGKTSTIGLLLKTQVTGQRFTPATIDLAFDTTKLALTGARVDTLMLAASSVTFTPTATGARLNVAGISAVNGKGRLLKLDFRGGDVTTNTNVPVTIPSMLFTGGCFTPRTEQSIVRVLPRNYGMTAAGRTYSFNWNASTNDYDPSTAVFEMDVTNTGDLPVSGLTATLPDTNDIKVVNGSTHTVAVVPSSLAVGEKGVARWQVKARPRADEKGLQLDVIVRNAEGTQAKGPFYVNIKAAASAVTVTATVDTIRTTGGAHTPDPALVRAVVRSAGTATGPAGEVELLLPSGLVLQSGAQAVQTFAALAPNATAPLQWPVEYPKNLSVDSTFALRLVRRAAGYPNDTTRLALRVPPLTGPQYTAGCLEGPTPLAWDTAKRAYPDFTLTARVQNTGAGAGGTLTGLITIPAKAMLDAGEMMLKTVSTGLGAGDTASVSWKIRLVSGLQACSGDTLRFGYQLRDVTNTIVDCIATIVFLPRPNRAPAITGQTPSKLDTLAKDKQQTFGVTASDPEADALTYQWYVDGVMQPGAGPSFNATFATEGSHTVRCVVRDVCGALTETGWTFVVRVLVIESAAQAADFRFLGNHPNPFTGRTALRYHLPEGAHDVLLDVVDAAGRTVATLVQTRQSGGAHDAVFDARALPSGTYTARLRVGSEVRALRLLHTK